MTVVIWNSSEAASPEGIIVTLEHFVPLERQDGIPWTDARIQEAATSAGPWTQIDDITLAPTDTDPANPATRNLTTHFATLTEGWYRVVWADGAGGVSSPTAPIQNLSDLAGGVRPSVQEVAARVRARTKVKGGAELGTFTTLTRPTAADVEDLIDDALDEVLGKVQPIDGTLAYGSAFNAPGSDYERRIRRAVALYAAINVELSFFPEQVRNNQSPVAIYQQMYDSRIRALISEGETGRAEGMGEGASGAGDAPGDAYWSFPDAAPGVLVGWVSRW